MSHNEIDSRYISPAKRADLALNGQIYRGHRGRPFKGRCRYKTESIKLFGSTNRVIVMLGILALSL